MHRDIVEILQQHLSPNAGMKVVDIIKKVIIYKIY